MDESALRKRRAARERQVRRRRRRGFAGALVALLGLVAALTAGGAAPGSHAQRAATTSLPPGTSSRAPARGAAASAAGRTRGGGETERSAAAAGRTPAPGETAPRSPAAHARTTANPRRPVAAQPGAHRAPRESVPILMYHVIGTRGPLTTNPGLWVSAAELEAQVHALRRAGYHGVTLQDVWNAWHRRGKLPRKPVVLSFDDGYAGQVRDALPILAEAGWPGVLNLELRNLADIGGTKAVKRLIAAGWEVDAHTISHPDLTTLGREELHEQVAGSRARLRRLLGVAVSFFCYPSGRYDARVIAAVKAAGYLAATTTQPGLASPASDPFALSRVRVDGGMSPDALLQRLRDARAATPAAPA